MFYKDDFNLDNENSRIQNWDIEEYKNEEYNNSLSLIDRIDAILKIKEAINNQKINKEDELIFQNILNNHLSFCSNILGINELQTLIFSYILNGNMMSLESLSKSFKISKIKGFKYLDDLDILAERRLINQSNINTDHRNSYWVPFEVVQSLRKGVAFTIPHYYYLSNYEFLRHLGNLVNNFQNENIYEKTMMLDFINLLKDNPHLQFVKNIYSYSISEESMFLISCLSVIKSKSDRSILSRRDRLIDEMGYQDLIRKISKRVKLSELFDKDLIEYAGDDFIDEEDIILSKKASFELLGIKETLLMTDPNFLEYIKIIPKEMFYNTKEKEYINQLLNILKEENYKTLKRGYC